MIGYDDAVKFQVQNVIELLNTIYKEEQNGSLTREEAQAQAIKLIKGLRYGDKRDGYFWIDDTNYILSPTLFCRIRKVKTATTLKIKTAS